MTDYRREQIKSLIRHYKSTHPCVSCGEGEPEKLTFHHRNPQSKKFEVSDAPRATHSISRVHDEIAKCDILCLDCHAALHGRTGNAKLDVLPPSRSNDRFFVKGRVIRFSLDV